MLGLITSQVLESDPLWRTILNIILAFPWTPIGRIPNVINQPLLTLRILFSALWRAFIGIVISCCARASTQQASRSIFFELVGFVDITLDGAIMAPAPLALNDFMKRHYHNPVQLYFTEHP